MKKTTLLILFVFIVGCSNKEQYLPNKDIQYQRFLSEKNLKALDEEMNHYDKK